MNEQKPISTFTLLLSAVAGFCDTATFVSGDSIFSAHVTGNFIVFAAQVIVGNDNNAWIKLLTFPVFVIAVIIGGWLAEKSSNKYFILLIEGILLLLCGIATSLHSVLRAKTNTVLYCIVMMIVFAKGLQNAFGKLYAKETYGPTTMMTGNVTQASLDLGSLIRKGVVGELSASLKKQLYLIGGFLLGCLFGALVSKAIGLMSVFIPAFILMMCYFSMKKNQLSVDSLKFGI